MSIGTAAPSEHELYSVKHHFIHHKSIHEEYNVGAFEKEALATLNILFKSHDIIIMVGGSGLYVDAISKGLDDFPEVDKSIREELNKTLQLEGLPSLQRQLKQLDPESYHTITIDNPHRVIRALEICIGTGKPYSSFLNKKKSERSFHTISIGLNADRSIIYNRINTRVDQMISNGLLDEVKHLENFKDVNALNTVGYKELFNFLDHSWSLDFAISEIKKNTRRFAKRQLTWFKKDQNIIWFDYQTNLKSIISEIEHTIQLHKMT
jgi:tRNA dimethylallyltransferase